MNGRPHFKSLKSREDVLRLHDGCRALLLFCNSQNPSGVLMSGSFEPHWGIHHVAFRGTALHGRRQTFGVRRGRLVDALGRLRPGWNSSFDGLRLDRILRGRKRQWRPSTRPQVHRSSPKWRSSPPAPSKSGSVSFLRSRATCRMCSIPIGPSCIICADPARDGGRSTASRLAIGGSPLGAIAKADFDRAGSPVGWAKALLGAVPTRSLSAD